MRYVMLNLLSPEDIAIWEGWTEEQQADVQRHVEEAIAIASEWPSLEEMPNSTVQLQPVFARD